MAVARERSAHQPTAAQPMPPTTGACRPRSAVSRSAGRRPAAASRAARSGDVHPYRAEPALRAGWPAARHAAIVFMVVAWANYGVVVRASILGGAHPERAGRAAGRPPRGLAATAETFAALGLLLLLLDGWAVWYVNLGGPHRATADPGFYAGAVVAFTAIFGYGYARVVGPTASRFVALLAAQPVLPLLVLDSSAEIAGWSVVFTAVALGDLRALPAADRAGHRSGGRRRATARRVGPGQASPCSAAPGRRCLSRRRRARRPSAASPPGRRSPSRSAQPRRRPAAASARLQRSCRGGPGSGCWRCWRTWGCSRSAGCWRWSRGCSGPIRTPRSPARWRCSRRPGCWRPGSGRPAPAPPPGSAGPRPVAW